MNRTRYQHLGYSRDLDDRLCDAAARCVADCRIGEPAFTQRYYSFGVVEAFADMVQVSPLTWLPRSGVLLWTVAEFREIAGLLEQMAS